MTIVIVVTTWTPAGFCLNVGDRCAKEISDGLTVGECKELVKYLEKELKVDFEIPEDEEFSQHCALVVKKVTRHVTFSQKAQGLLQKGLQSLGRTDLNRCLNDHYPDFIHIDEDYEEEDGSEGRWTQEDNAFTENVLFGSIITLSLVVIGAQIYRYSLCLDDSVYPSRDFIKLRAYKSTSERKKLSGSNSSQSVSDGDEVEFQAYTNSRCLGGQNENKLK